MATIASILKQADESFQSGLNIVKDIDLRNPNVQELKNAAKQAIEAAAVLNRLIGAVLVINSIIEKPQAPD